ncbi:MAG: hypothetical protein M9933_07985 [Chitinophagaceae bacterium]|nr:hypothetical protein [Chitinophagaceae bacterium]
MNRFISTFPGGVSPVWHNLRQLSGKVYVTDAKGRKWLSSYKEGKVEINYKMPGKGVCNLEVVHE